MGDVAALLGVVQSTATRLVEPLVAQDCVRRESAPEDGRVVMVALTPKGRRWAEDALASSLRWSEEVLGRIPEAKRPEILEALEALVGAVDDCCGEGLAETSCDESATSCAPVKRGA